jgi:hypothetical protein
MAAMFRTFWPCSNRRNEEDSLTVITWTPHLKLGRKEGSPMDEYRIRAGRVEVRALDANGDPYPRYSEWIPLTPEEIKIHFVKYTPVAQWLTETLKKQRETELTPQRS